VKDTTRAFSPADQHLYVMQNEYGLIKVGRSLDPERRRLTLQSKCRCQIALVANLPNRGTDEEWAHGRLVAHRLGYEWFAGTAEARHAVSRLLRLGSKVTWPFEHDEPRAKVWLDEFLDDQAVEYWRRVRYKTIGTLKGALAGLGGMAAFQHGGADLDGRIAFAMGHIGCYTVKSIGGVDVVVGFVSELEEDRPMPLYTRLMEAAQSLWPSWLERSARRPVATPLECCIAALCICSRTKCGGRLSRC
jgi:hypothetical protein